MNQIVTDVIEITHHSIERMALDPTRWVVWGHGPDNFVQLIDSYDTLEEAEKEYPMAWRSASETGILLDDDYDWPSDTIPQ